MKSPLQAQNSAWVPSADIIDRGISSQCRLLEIKYKRRDAVDCRFVERLAFGASIPETIQL